MKKNILAICAVAVGYMAMTAQTKNTQTLVPLAERVNVQADSARVDQIIDGCWVAVGTKKNTCHSTRLHPYVQRQTFLSL